VVSLNVCKEYLNKITFKISLLLHADITQKPAVRRLERSAHVLRTHEATADWRHPDSMTKDFLWCQDWCCSGSSHTWSAGAIMSESDHRYSSCVLYRRGRFFPAVQRRSDFVDPQSRSLPTSLCRQHGFFVVNLRHWSYRPPPTTALILLEGGCVPTGSGWTLQRPRSYYTGRRSHQLPQSSFRAGTDEVIPTAGVRDLRVNIDSAVVCQWGLTSFVCALVLRQLRSVRLSVSRSVLPRRWWRILFWRGWIEETQHSLAFRYYLLKLLQLVMNSAAQLVFSSSRSTTSHPLLRQLHWLKTRQRMGFKLAVFVYKCQHGAAPSYLADELSQPADFQAHGAYVPPLHHRWLSVVRGCQLSATEPFR